MLRATLTLGFFGFLWVDKFTMKNGISIQVPSYHARHQLVQRGHALFGKVVENGPNGEEVPPISLCVHSNAHVQWQQWRPIRDAAAVQPLGTTLPLQGWDTTHSQVTPDRAMWLRYSQFNDTCTAGRAGHPSDTIQELIRYETCTLHLLTHIPDTRTMAAAQ